MPQVIDVILLFSMECLKLLLIIKLFSIAYHRKAMLIGYALCMAVLLVVAFYFGREYIQPGIAAVVVMAFAIKEKRQAGWMILSFLVISIFDLITAILLSQKDLPIRNFFPEEVIYYVENGVTFVCLLLILVFFQLYRGKRLQIPVNMYFMLFLLESVSITVYLTVILLMLSGRDLTEYRDVMIAGLLGSSVISVILSILLIRQNEKNIRQQYENDIIQKTMHAENEYYRMLLERDEETRAFRHDYQNHIHCLRLLLEEGDREKLRSYLAELDQAGYGWRNGVDTGNRLVSAILSDLLQRFPECEIGWRGKLPEELSLTQAETGTVFYNLFLNAFEAARKADDKKVSVEIRCLAGTLYVMIENARTGELLFKGQDIRTTKTGGAHGYGIKNVRKTVEAHGGTLELLPQEGFFVVNLIL